jgi:hypothetical protein
MQRYTINLQTTPSYATATEPEIVLNVESARGVPVTEAVDVDFLTAALKSYAARDGVVVGPDGAEAGKLRALSDSSHPARAFAVVVNDSMRGQIDAGVLKQLLISVSNDAIVEARIVDYAAPSVIAQAAHAQFAKAYRAAKREMIFAHPVKPRAHAVAKRSHQPSLSPLAKSILAGRHVLRVGV